MQANSRKIEYTKYIFVVKTALTSERKPNIFERTTEGFILMLSFKHTFVLPKCDFLNDLNRYCFLLFLLSPVDKLQKLEIDGVAVNTLSG